MPRRRTTDPLGEYRRKRDFGRTSEPAGEVRGPAGEAHLEFVIQKHDATNLHYDLRLELDGVMKSWAVPRGMTFDPAVKRLAMEVEDHPMDYNLFEGTIPSGEYGGGTVLIWDRGVYFADEAGEAEDQEAVLRRELAAGKMSVTFVGQRMRGSYALVRTESGEHPKWLLIKHRDAFVRRAEDPGAEYPTSVVTGRTLQEVEEEDATDGFADAGISAMLYRYATELPEGSGWTYEPAIRGARVHLYVTPEGRSIVTAMPRTGKRYREIGADLVSYAAGEGRSFVLDGEVAPDDDGKLILHVFDLLFEDGAVLLEASWSERRERLEKLMAAIDAEDVVLVPAIQDTTEALLERARSEEWAGIVAKRVESVYSPGKRTGDWVKFVFTDGRDD